MEKLYQNYLEQISAQDWEKTPASVKKLPEEMVQQIEKLEKHQAEVLALQQQLLEKVKLIDHYLAQLLKRCVILNHYLLCNVSF